MRTKQKPPISPRFLTETVISTSSPDFTFSGSTSICTKAKSGKISGKKTVKGSLKSFPIPPFPSSTFANMIYSPSVSPESSKS